MFAEGYAQTGLGEAIDSWLALDAGLTVGLRPQVQLDASAGVGLTSAATDWFVSGGLSVRLPR